MKAACYCLIEEPSDVPSLGAEGEKKEDREIVRLLGHCPIVKRGPFESKAKH